MKPVAECRTVRNDKLTAYPPECDVMHSPISEIPDSVRCCPSLLEFGPRAGSAGRTLCNQAGQYRSRLDGVGLTMLGTALGRRAARGRLAAIHPARRVRH